MKSGKRKAKPGIHPDMLKGIKRSQAAVAAAEAATGKTPQQLAEERQRDHEAYQNDVAAKRREALLGPEPVLTQAEITALTQPTAGKKEETWSEAVKGMLFALGAVAAFIWIVAVGVGGCAAFIIAMGLFQKAAQWH